MCGGGFRAFDEREVLGQREREEKVLIEDVEGGRGRTGAKIGMN